MNSENENANSTSQTQQPSQQQPPADEDAHVASVLPPAKPLVTFTLLAANALVFAAMVVTGASAMEPRAADLLKWGADFGPLMLAGEWWRPFTCMFVHIGVLHLALNMWCLLDLGSVVERLFGRGSFLGLYLLSGLGGSAASLWWNPEIISAGASGAVFGVAGSLAAVLFAKRLPLPPEVTKAKLNSVVVFIGYNVFYGFARTGIDNAAHLGGLAVGFLLGLLLPVTLRTPEASTLPMAESKRGPAVLAATAVALAGAFWFVQNTHAGYAEIEQARVLVNANQCDGAIAILKGVVERRPKLVDAHFLLGYCHMQKGDNDAAETAFRSAVQLAPNSANIHLNLGVVYLRQDKLDAAIPFLQKAALDPSLWQASFNLGLVYLLKGDAKAAVPLFTRAASLEPNEPDVHTYLGKAQLEAGETDAAMASLQRSLQLKPDDAQVLGDLALAYTNKGMKKEADDALARQAELIKRQTPPE